jgi:hypothetical protein
MLVRRGPNFADPQENQYFFTLKAPPVDQAPPRPRHRDAIEPWLLSADKIEDLRALILACEYYFSRNPWE